MIVTKPPALHPDMRARMRMLFHPKEFGPRRVSVRDRAPNRSVRSSGAGTLVSNVIFNDEFVRPVLREDPVSGSFV